MFRKYLKETKKTKQELGLRTTIDSILFRLGLRRQYLITYPLGFPTIKVDKGPLSFWKRLERGLWEIDLIRFIVELVRPGETILDVGASIGALTFLFSHLVGETGTIYAFEPMPKSFFLLGHHAASNNIDNVHLCNVAVSNVAGYVTLYSRFPTDSMATMLKPEGHEAVLKASEYKIQQKCKSITIDEFCSSQNIHPNGIKIDVEGAEGNVLDGAIETIQNHHPWCLLEFHGHLISESERKRIWSFITNRAKKMLYVQGNQVALTYKMEVLPDFQPTKRANYCIFF